MDATLLLVGKILGVLVIAYKFISPLTYIGDRDQMIDLMGKSFLLRAGSFSSRRTE